MDALNQAQLRSRSPRQFYDKAKFIGATVGPQGRIWQHEIISSTTLLFWWNSNYFVARLSVLISFPLCFAAMSAVEKKTSGISVLRVSPFQTSCRRKI